MKCTAEYKRLIELANNVLPGGTFGNFEGDMIIRSGRGGRVTDVSGNEYIDFLLGSGPMLLGHGHPEVVAAVIDQIGRGSTFFANNEHGIELAAEIVEAFPCAEQVRFASSGTEADAIAMRAARAYSGRSKMLKFGGGYHGVSDYALIGPADNDNSARGVPESAGIPECIRDEILVAPYNDLQAAQELILTHRDELGGVIVEPYQRLLAPVPGFLEGLRHITRQHDIPLIFDEVVTGFRLAYGGAQEYYGVIPDICTLGKVVGGGYTLSAIAGRADIMAHFDKMKAGENGFLPHVGTLSGNPIAAVAGLTTLRILKRPGTYDKLRTTGDTIRVGLEKALRDNDIPAVTAGFSAMFDAFFTDRPTIETYRDVVAANAKTSARFNALLREHGLLKNIMKIYISLAHDEDDIRHALDAFNKVAQILAEEKVSR